MYPLLHKGDTLPSVAAVQILINRALTRGETIKVDGIYGRQTKQAVLDFQRRNPPLAQDGIVGPNTWAKLVWDQRLNVVDAVDVTNPKDLGIEDSAIMDAGGDPIMNFGMCNGARVVINNIISRAQRGSVVLLRFHGHGAPGYMGADCWNVR